jgi:hypothetical protein
MSELTQDQRWQLEAAADRAAEVYAANGKILPKADENGQLVDPLAYRRELLRSIQFNSRYSHVDLSKVPAQELDRFEAEVFADATQNALSPLDLRPGELREIIRTDRTGRTIHEFASRGPGAFRNTFSEFMKPPLVSAVHVDGVVQTAPLVG